MSKDINQHGIIIKGIIQLGRWFSYRYELARVNKAKRIAHRRAKLRQGVYYVFLIGGQYYVLSSREIKEQIKRGVFSRDFDFINRNKTAVYIAKGGKRSESIDNSNLKFKKA